MENWRFWKTVSVFFSTKITKGDKILFNENDKSVPNDNELCQIFFGYFSNTIFELQIPNTYESISKVTDITDPALAVIDLFKDHSIIKNIRTENFKSVFSLTHINKIEIKIGDFGKQFLYFFQQRSQKVIKSSLMKMINLCLMTTNYVKYFLATSLILFLNFKFQIHTKVFQK